jgi:hypothetical protein
MATNDSVSERMLDARSGASHMALMKVTILSQTISSLETDAATNTASIIDMA